MLTFFSHRDWKKDHCREKANQIFCFSKHRLTFPTFRVSFDTFGNKNTCSSHCTVCSPLLYVVLLFSSDYAWFRVCRSRACPEFCPAAAAAQPGAFKQVCPMFLAEEPDTVKRLFVLKIRRSDAACCDEQKLKSFISHSAELTRV